jgi:hypothetical protein
MMIYGDNNNEFILDTCITFGSNNVSLISKGPNTSYVCEFNCSEIYCIKCIMEITLSKSFRMIGGILKYGNCNKISFCPSSSFYFVDINDNGYFSLSDIKLIFVGKMKSMIYIRGGSLCIEYMNVINESWIQPLIEVYGIISSIIIELHGNNISNCDYTYSNIESEISTYKSAIIFIDNMSTEDILLNISNCLFYKNIINLFYNDSGYGNICHYYSLNKSSSILFFLFIQLKNFTVYFIIFFFFFFFFFFYFNLIN